MALGSLRTNRLRSALTMLGVAIGVFSVIGVMTALSVIQGSIESGLSFLGSNIFQFAKYPVINTRDPEEKFANRRNISLDQANEFKRLMEGQAQAIALKVFDGGKPVSYGNVTLQGRTLVGTNEFFLAANSYSIALRPQHLAGRRRARAAGDGRRRVASRRSSFPARRRSARRSRSIRSRTRSSACSTKRAPRSATRRTISCSCRSRSSSPTSATSTARSIWPSSRRRRRRTTSTLDKAIGAMRAARGLKLGQDNDFEIYSNDTLVTAFAQVADTVRVGRVRGQRDRAAGRRHRHHEHHAGQRHRANARDRRAQSDRRAQVRHHQTVPDRGRAPLRARRTGRNPHRRARRKRHRRWPSA